jgi:hypothetical protein
MDSAKLLAKANNMNVAASAAALTEFSEKK